MTKKTTALLIVVFAAMPAHADRLDCHNPHNTIEINECAEQERQDVDEKVEILYKKLLASCTAPESSWISCTKFRHDIENSQVEWRRFQEVDCMADSELWKNGSGRGFAYSHCMKKHAEMRIERLKELLED